MAGIGIAFTDLGELIAVLNVKTIFICAMIVIGAIIGSGIVGIAHKLHSMACAQNLKVAGTASVCHAKTGCHRGFY